jgi:hypothetical protein
MAPPWTHCVEFTLPYGREEIKREKHLPDEPRAAGSVRAVLSPGAEVVSACDALPACPPDGEVGLPGEVLLWCPVISVAQICVVYVANVQSQTLVRVPDRPAVHAT